MMLPLLAVTSNAAEEYTQVEWIYIDQDISRQSDGGYEKFDTGVDVQNANSLEWEMIASDFGEWNSFPVSFMQKLKDKLSQNVTFIFKYKVNHKLQIIRIPAGTPIDTSCDWYGPDKMKELYAAEE